MNRCLLTLGLFAYGEASSFLYLLGISKDNSCRVHFQHHLSDGLGLVSANGKEISLGDKGVRRSQAISPHCSIQKQPYLLCVCNPSSQRIGHHFLCLGSSKPSPCSKVGKGSLLLLISGLF